jgi:hypothetical protein
MEVNDDWEILIAAGHHRLLREEKFALFFAKLTGQVPHFCRRLSALRCAVYFLLTAKKES